MEKRTVDVSAGVQATSPASPTIPPAVAIDGGFRDCLPSALAWAARGFTVFRLGEGRKDAKGIYFLETGVTNPDEIARIFQPGTRSNIGWCTGRTFKGHWVAIDLDVKDGRKGPETILGAAWKAGVGAVSVEQLAAATGAVSVRTPSGGYHLIYDGGVALDYSQSSALWSEEFGADCGVDVRARHGYCVAPGSWARGKDGAIAYYEVVGEPDGAIGALPDWIRDRLLTHEQRSRGALEVSGHNGSALLRLNGVLVSGKGQGEWSPEVIEDARRGVLHERLRAIEGNRNNTGYAVAAYLRRNMAFSVGLARELLDVWNEKMCQPAMEPWRLDALAEHAGRYGKDLLGIGNWDAVYAAVGEVVGAQEVEGRGWAARMDKGMEEAARAWAEIWEAGRTGGPAVGNLSGTGGEANGRTIPRTDIKVAPVLNPANGLHTETAEGYDEENVRWLVPNAIAIGKLNVLLGEGGKGKSQLTLAIAAAVTHGLPLGAAMPDGGAAAEGLAALASTPLGIAPAPGRVLAIADEDSWRDTIKPRIHSAGARRDMVHHLKGSFRFEGGKWIVADAFALDRDIEGLRQWLKCNPDTKLLIVDPLNAYFGEKADSFKSADLRRVLSPFAKLADATDIAILAIMHPNKKNEGNVVSWISGAAAIGQMARSVWAQLDDPRDGGWREEGRRNRRQMWCWAKGNVGASHPVGLHFEVLSHDYLRPDGRMFINSSRVVPLGPCDKLADEVAKELKEVEARKTDGRRAENKESSPRQLAKQIIYEKLAKAPDFELASSTLIKLVEGEGAVSRPTYFRARGEMIKERQITTHTNEFLVDMVRLADFAQPGLPGEPKFIDGEG